MVDVDLLYVALSLPDLLERCVQLPEKDYCFKIACLEENLEKFQVVCKKVFKEDSLFKLRTFKGLKDGIKDDSISIKGVPVVGIWFPCERDVYLRNENSNNKNR